MEYKDNQNAEVHGMMKDLSILLAGIVALGGLITLILVWMQGS